MNVFEVTDKTGRRIRLTRERWTHITDPRSQHPYMANSLEEMKKTLVDPALIVKQKFDDARRNYYFYLKEKKRYLLVAANYLNGEGEVNSVYDEERQEKMNRETLDIYYDTEADILEITIGEPSPCYFDEVDDDIFEAHDEETDKLKGYKIFNFKKRGGMRNVKVSLLVGVVLSSKEK